MNYKVMDYQSTLLWHFVRNSTKAAIDILLEDILFDNSQGQLLTSPKKGDNYYPPISVSFQLPRLSDMKIGETIIVDKLNCSFLEPRAVCFADIPFNFLPVHFEKYPGVGIGFRKVDLLDLYQEVSPVHYYPKNIKKVLDKVSTRFEDDYKRKLNPFVKIAENDEEFKKIYMEREWRSMDSVFFSPDIISCFVFENSNDFEKAKKNEKIVRFVERGVSLLRISDFFEKSMENIKL